ncbi:protein windbeutel [Zeugodacus cucurbitae]|uniref:Protein windbeutel n=1 Tax=Zeugodacus cucurbitae TaxID=28588 RepID=A0A0A1XHF8_ZEUCU|nr:protein windbeutel [Zeugodacus cucurbitae]XP_054090151.1 protein windbeutel [Zeugodacus cucurbitae]
MQTPTKYLNFAQLLASLLLVAWTPTAVASSCAGCVELDELNFEQTVERFPYALVKFDIAFPYGDKHEAFAAFSRTAHKVTKDLLVATVGIKDYGENENRELGLRFKVDDKNFPGILLFKAGKLHSFERFPTHLEVTLDNLKQFVTQHTELYIGRDGCLKDFEELVKKYANKDDAEQVELIAKAEQMAQGVEGDETKTASAKAYLIYMRKINEKGYDYVDDETKRLLRLKAGKVTDAKKLELQRKLNILEAFRVTKLTKVKRSDEL